MFLQTMASSRSVLLLAPALATNQLKLLMVLLLTLISRLVVLNRNGHGGLPKLLLMFMVSLVLPENSLNRNTSNMPLIGDLNAPMVRRWSRRNADKLA
jgi:hypothetical protein